MSDDEDKVEKLNTGKSLTDASVDKLLDSKKKESKNALDKQAKVVADALTILKNEHRKFKEMEEDHNAIDEDRALLKKLNLD